MHSLGPASGVPSVVLTSRELLPSAQGAQFVGSLSCPISCMAAWQRLFRSLMPVRKRRALDEGYAGGIKRKRKVDSSGLKISPEKNSHLKISLIHFFYST